MKTIRKWMKSTRFGLRHRDHFFTRLHLDGYDYVVIHEISWAQVGKSLRNLQEHVQ